MTIRERVSNWVDKVNTAGKIHNQNPIEALVLVLGKEGAKKLVNGWIGNAALAIDETRLIFHPDHYFPGINRYQDPPLDPKDPHYQEHCHLRDFINQYPDSFSPIPPWRDPDDPATYSLKDYKKTTLKGPPDHPDERYLAWYKPPAGDQPIIAYFHGNAGSLDVRAPVLAELAKPHRGCGVMIVAYPGFRGSKKDSIGKKQSCSMHGCYRAGEAMVDWLRENHPHSRIAYFGESLGGHVAIHTAHVKQQKQAGPVAIICLNTLYSVPEWIKDYFDKLQTGHIKNHLNSGELIGGVDADILIMHSTEDKVTNSRHGKMLKDASDAAGRKKTMHFPLKGMDHLLSYYTGPKNPGDPPPEATILGPLQEEEIIDPKKVARVITTVQDFLKITDSRQDKNDPDYKRAVSRWKRRHGELPATGQGISL